MVAGRGNPTTDDHDDQGKKVDIQNQGKHAEKRPGDQEQRIGQRVALQNDDQYKGDDLQDERQHQDRQIDTMEPGYESAQWLDCRVGDGDDRLGNGIVEIDPGRLHQEPHDDDQNIQSKESLDQVDTGVC